MRTILVNPRRRRRSRRRHHGGLAVVRNASLAPNPRRRRSRRRKHHTWGMVAGHPRRVSNPTFFMANPRRRRRRRNALILPNRRRYRRRNPSFSIGSAFNTVLMGALGGGGAYAFNAFVVRKIQLQPDGSYPTSALYWHVAARAVASVIAGFFLPSSVASAANGALAYASIDEVVSYRANQAAAAQGADLSGLEADLADVLDGY